MHAKLILVAEQIAFDDQGRVSAQNLLLDTLHGSFPATLEKVDLLTLWTRDETEPQKQLFELSLEIGGEALPPETIPVDFQGGFEAWQGISLDGFVIEKPGPVVFHFAQAGEHKGVWVLRAHQIAEAVGDA